MDAFTLPDRCGLIKLMLAIGVIQILAYLFCANLASPGAHLAVPQPDTLLYCQSARQIVEGMPFVFTPGDKPSTGCTSHLYPFVLAVPYALGAKGPALVTAGFFLNAAFYLVFLFSWAVIIFHIVEDKWAQAAACLLVALGGQAAYSAMAQSDVGFFMAVSAAIFAALTAGRFWLFAALLWLSPWCRPEGMMLILSYGGLLAWRGRYGAEKPVRREWLALAVGVVSVSGVFALNYALTGYFQFTSVLFKTYFKQYPLHFAFALVFKDLITIGKELFLGIPANFPRDSFYLPVLGAVFAWLAVFVRDWRRSGSWQTVWWLGASLLSVISVAISGWQNTNSDRYLAWLLPLWLVLMAEGSVACARWLKRPAVAWLPFAALAAFQVVGAIAAVSTYLPNSYNAQRDYDFALDAAAKLPAGASVGASSGRLAYAWPGLRLCHLRGLYSPAFLTCDLQTNLEMLKHEPQQRFDYWLFYGETDDGRTWGGVNITPLVGEKLVVGADNNYLAQARWEALDQARLPVSGLINQQLADHSLTLVDRLDIGYLRDEKAHDYYIGNRFHGLIYNPFGLVDTNGTNSLIDIGRAIVGWDEMTVRLHPGCDAVMVMRTAAAASVRVTGGRASSQTSTFASPLRMRLLMGAWDSGVLEMPMEEGTNTFTEVSAIIPGAAILSAENRLEIYGDRAVFAYWFYQ